ncbi:MAG: calcium-binding protein [Nostoc sp.]|uniref:calcium-binding protein n=1 Tax=Nostoc sp. TaxID=1180 RepID=UPI002FF589DB
MATINGTNGPDNLSGGVDFFSFGDIINGFDGNDTIFGGDGDDTLIGGAGTDTLTGGGGFGNDVFKFNSVSESQPGVLRDVITDFAGVGNGIFRGDQIDLSTIDANSTIAGNQAFTFIGASAFSAPGQVRYSEGILQANTDGNLSADFEIQLTGAPQLVASDIILSGTFTFSDTLTFNDSDEGISTSTDGTTSDGGLGIGDSSASSGEDGGFVDIGANDNFNRTIKGGSGNDTINAGGTGNDTIDGGAGNDTINGGRGNDILTGGTGADILTGGSGNDIFKYNSTSESPLSSRDLIADFRGNGSLPGDRIDLSSIDANSTIGGNQAFTFIGSGQFSAPGQIRYSGDILQGNTDGNLSANFEIRLIGAPQLVSSELIL